MKNPFTALLSILGLTSSAKGRDIALKEGECWSYSTRPGEEASFLVIRKIETLPRVGEVIQISVYGLRVKSPSAPKGFTDSVNLPIAGASLRSSLKERVQKRIPDADWQEGYRIWRETKGKGVFTESVSECVGCLEEFANREEKG